jgi:hypothetical protein
MTLRVETPRPCRLCPRREEWCAQVVADQQKAAARSLETARRAHRSLPPVTVTITCPAGAGPRK